MKSHFSDLPPNTLTSTLNNSGCYEQGLIHLPYVYHTAQVIKETEDVKETGHDLHYLMDQLIVNQYPHYLKYVHEYCRPLGTTDATFNNFNCEQKPSKPHTKSWRSYLYFIFFRRL